MGGAEENDNAMRWFLQRANGGDVVVLRASGADGYNDYLFNELGVSVNSVQTIITTTVEAANDPYVARQIRNAEALWIAGGDQWDYVSFWKNGPVGKAIQYLISEKKAVVGGTSAGMAILSGAYFSAENGTIKSEEALADPFSERLKVGYNDFLHTPFLEKVITDTHYDARNRKGRHAAFLARLIAAHGPGFQGIACEEYTAVCINTNGVGQVFGNQPQARAYFIQSMSAPETCAPGVPLDWRNHGQAMQVGAIPGTDDGRFSFDLKDWKTTTGGTWEYWWVENGVFKSSTE